MKQNKNSLIGWILLTILLILIVVLTYLKLSSPNPNIKETPVENSEEEAINLALTEIVNNFNESEKIKQYEAENIKLNALLKNHSIYISYENDTLKTYEFNYSNLYLTIKIKNSKENIEKFKKIYEVLIYAIQKRIGNEQQAENEMQNILEDKKTYKGLSKKEEQNSIIYTINITEKIKSDSNE